jgi:alkanesulfonate monooxygenase SsuD/methylene tetrahydromethanopterin reductase-like flavin-dependent oxidoreductase (luciferase family)
MVSRMQLRIFTEPQQGAGYDTLLAVARATEDGGFDAFFRSDHYMAIWAASPARPTPGSAWPVSPATPRASGWAPWCPR